MATLPKGRDRKVSVDANAIAKEFHFKKRHLSQQKQLVVERTLTISRHILVKWSDGAAGKCLRLAAPHTHRPHRHYQQVIIVAVI